MDISVILMHGLIVSLLITFAMLFVGMKGPRLMLQNYPKSIQDATTPRTKREKKLGILYAIPLLAIMILYPLIVGYYYYHHSDFTLLQTIFLTWGILLFFNLYDLLVLDWLIICAITPRFVVVPGTEGNKGYKDYLFHFKGFLKGIIITLLVATLMSLSIMVISKF